MSGFAFTRLEVAREGKQLLGPLDLQIPSKGITALMGENGSGKSLFLESCHGLIEPQRGTVTWNGSDVRQSRRERGYIFQNTVPLRRSVAQNIAFALTVAQTPRAAHAKRLAELLAMVRLADKADQPASLLSGGELQRMALARALAVGPKYLLIDEPTANLDPKSTALFEQILLALRDSGIGVLWATHDPQQVRRCADYILFLKDGHVVEHGQAIMIVDHPQTDTSRAYFP